MRLDGLAGNLLTWLIFMIILPMEILEANRESSSSVKASNANFFLNVASAHDTYLNDRGQSLFLKS